MLGYSGETLLAEQDDRQTQVPMGLHGGGVTQQPHSLMRINFGQCSAVHATLAAVLLGTTALRLAAPSCGCCCDGLELAGLPGPKFLGSAPADPFECRPWP